MIFERVLASTQPMESIEGDRGQLSNHALITLNVISNPQAYVE